MLTYAYWARRFGRDPSVLGRTMTIDGARATVVGVLQRTSGPLERDIAVFSPARWPTPTRKGPFFVTVFGRLRPGVSPTAAAEALAATNARLFPIWRSSFQNEKATWGLVDLKTRVVGDVGSTLVFVLAAVACVLLIACANAVNLLIARSLHRGRELAIRGALGATTSRLLQYVLVEACVLTAAAALIGLGVAVLALQLVALYGADYVPRIDEVRFSATAFAWLAGLAAASGIVIGIVPAWHGTRLRVDQALRSGGRSSTVGPTSRRVQRALVAAEFALATPLLVAGALLLVSLDRLTRVPVGVDTTHLLTASVSLPRTGYARDADRAAFWKRAVERLAALPGVQSVALSDSRPPSESGQQNNFDLEDRPTPAGQNQPVCTVGRRVAWLLHGRWRDARARPSARRAIAPGGRRGRRPGLGGALLPRPGGRRPPLPQRRLHDLPVDDRRRRRRRRALDRPRRGRAGRHGLLPLRGSVERLLPRTDRRRPSGDRAVRAPGGEGAGSRPGARRRRDRR